MLTELLHSGGGSLQTETKCYIRFYVHTLVLKLKIPLLMAIF